MNHHTRPYAKSLRVAACLFAVAVQGLRAAELDYRENQVEVLPAADGGTTLKTGENSKAQLAIGGGVLRVGSKTETYLSSSGDQLDLKQGVMMVSSGRSGLRRDAVNIETPVAQIKAKATMLINYQPTKYIKISCIEGTVTVALKSLLKDTVTIREGQVLVINCHEDHSPKLFDIDLRRLLGSSSLVGGRFPGVRRIDGRSTGRGRGRNDSGRRPPPRQAGRGDPSRPGGGRGPQNNAARGRDRLPPSQAGRENQPPPKGQPSRSSGSSKSRSSGSSSSPSPKPSPKGQKPPSKH
jgi:hypothetical protein